jgi:hypothetical protein
MRGSEKSQVVLKNDLTMSTSIRMLEGKKQQSGLTEILEVEILELVQL